MRSLVRAVLRFGVWLLVFVVVVYVIFVVVLLFFFVVVVYGAMDERIDVIGRMVLAGVVVVVVAREVAVVIVDDVVVLVHVRSLVRHRGGEGRGIGGASISSKVREFGRVNGVKETDREGIVSVISSGIVGRGDVVAIVFVVVDRVVGTPLDDETRILDEGLAFVGRKGFNASDGHVGHGEGGPAVTGDTGAGGQG